MRSSAGVGTTPPKVLGAPKPQSSVIISSTFGAPLGGTTRGGHHGFESVAFCSISPPNFGSGAGSWFPGIVVVAFAEPNVPVTCGAELSLDCPRAAHTNTVTRQSEKQAAHHDIRRVMIDPF